MSNNINNSNEIKTNTISEYDSLKQLYEDLKTLKKPDWYYKKIVTFLEKNNITNRQTYLMYLKTAPYPNIFNNIFDIRISIMALVEGMNSYYNLNSLKYQEIDYLDYEGYMLKGINYETDEVIKVINIYKDEKYYKIELIYKDNDTIFQDDKEIYSLISTLVIE